MDGRAERQTGLGGPEWWNAKEGIPPYLLIAAEGILKIREPYVKHLEGQIWEMRMKGRDGIARAAYVTASGQRVVVVHVFSKKSQKTPRREIEMALRRAKEVT